MSWFTRVIRAIWDFLSRLFGHKTESDVAVAFRFTATIEGIDVPLGEGMALLLTDTQKVTLSVQAVDKKGFATTKFTGTPVWAINDGTVGVLTPAADGLSAELVAGAPGVAQVSATAGAVSGTLDVDVEPGDAATLVVTAGTPSEQ